jgi:hypothetical protein
MEIYDAVKSILENNSKTFKAQGKPYTLKISSTGGISIVKQIGKILRTNTLDITGENASINWQESRKPVALSEALAQDTRKVKPVGEYEFADAQEWLLRLCDERSLLNSLWEIE